MKKMIISSAIFMVTVLSIGSGRAQTAGSPFSSILDNYYEIKNALVAGDAAKAAKSAAAFNSAVSALDNKTVSAAESTVFKSVQTGLLTDSKTIAASTDVSKQRETFSKLSQNMITLAKGVKLSAQPVYVDYCPMKKSSWLSSEQAIKNPYYGSSMLSCGKITDTLK
ncbi:MAG TPA: DUF3347 domain-containing protein [Chitinophagaceae bacterium]|nr:DUF3347 domain-containing protein [Chitinophagaceae bacterium]